MSSDQSKNRQLWPFSYENLIQESLDLPNSLTNCVQQYFTPHFTQEFQILKTFLQETPIARVYFIGNTFNYFASRIARHELMAAQDNALFIWQTFELTDFYDYILPREPQPDTLFIFISKSGESRILQKALEHLHLLKFNPECMWMITNNPKARNAKFCGHIFPIFVDHESILSQKSFPHTIIVLYLLVQLLLRRDPLDKSVRKIIDELITNVKQFCQTWQDSTAPLNAYLGTEFDFLYIVSRDPSSTAAAQLLGLMGESFTRLKCEGITLGLFFHGPFQILDRKTLNFHIRCIVLGAFEANEQEDPMLIRLIQQIQARAGRVALLGNQQKILTSASENPNVIPVLYHTPCVAFAPIFQAYFLSLVFLNIAKKRGIIAP